MASWEYLVVDGHNILHQIPLFRRELSRNSRRARSLLIRWLQAYQDYSGIKVRIAFDGQRGTQEPAMAGGVEVSYAEAHQTADALIERAVGSYAYPQHIAVATDDGALSACVAGVGAACLSSEALLDECRRVLGRELEAFVAIGPTS